MGSKGGFIRTYGVLDCNLGRIPDYASTRGYKVVLGAWLDENQSHPLYDVTTRYFVQQAARAKVAYRIDPSSFQPTARPLADALVDFLPLARHAQ